MISKPMEKVVNEPVVKPRVLRSDFGNVLTEKQWNELQRRKREAEEKGFEIDEWSQ